MSWLVLPIHAFAFERAAVTPYTLATVLLPAIICFYVMAVLVQLRHTNLYRAALLPIVFWVTFRVHLSLDFSWNYPGYNYFNQGRSLGMFVVAVRSTAWAFSRETYVRLLVSKSSIGTTDDHAKNGSQDDSVSVAMWNAWDLLANLRAIGWVGPPRVRIAEPYFQVESRLVFLLLSLSRVVALVFVSDILRGCTHSFGPDTFGTSNGGTIFDSSLSPLERYMKSSAITLLAGLSAYLVIDSVYYLHAVLFTLLFQQYPSQWPPLFDSPWSSTSLHSFWAQRWHQLFREPFVMVGSRVLEKYLGSIGTVMGAFAVSGALHDVGARGMGRGADTLSMMGFFLLHGVGIILERVWKRVTGRRVGGVFGLLWVYFALISSGHIIVDSWARSGLLASEFFPEAYRPTVLLMNWISLENTPM